VCGCVRVIVDCYATKNTPKSLPQNGRRDLFMIPNVLAPSFAIDSVRICTHSQADTTKKCMRAEESTFRGGVARRSSSALNLCGLQEALLQQALFSRFPLSVNPMECMVGAVMQAPSTRKNQLPGSAWGIGRHLARKRGRRAPRTRLAARLRQAMLQLGFCAQS
jgi:hypothetical protein